MFSPDGEIVIALAYNTASLWALDGELIVNLVHEDGGALTSTRFSIDGRLLLTAGLDKTGARLWSREGRLQAVFPEGEYYASLAEFCPDGIHVVTRGKSLTFWNLDGTIDRTIDQYCPNDIVFAPPGTMLMRFDVERYVTLCDLDGQLIAELHHDDSIRTVSMSVDHYRILTASGRQAILWDMAGNRLSHVEHAGEIDSAKFSASGTYVLCRSVDNSAVLWDLVSPERIINYYRGRMPELSDAEKRVFSVHPSNAGSR